MSCNLFVHNDPIGGSKYISGTTCDGTTAYYTLTLGQSVCMNTTLPFENLCGLILSGSCLAVTPTPTTTPLTYCIVSGLTYSTQPFECPFDGTTYYDIYGQLRITATQFGAISQTHPPLTAFISNGTEFVSLTIPENTTYTEYIYLQSNFEYSGGTCQNVINPDWYVISGTAEICFFVTPTPTITPTMTPTNTITPTKTPTNTPTNTPTQTQTQTPTNTSSQTQTPTNTKTPTNTPTQTPTTTTTLTSTPTNTSSQTQTPTNTQTPSPTPLSCCDELIFSGKNSTFSAFTGTYYKQPMGGSYYAYLDDQAPPFTVKCTSYNGLYWSVWKSINNDVIIFSEQSETWRVIDNESSLVSCNSYLSGFTYQNITNQYVTDCNGLQVPIEINDSNYSLSYSNCNFPIPTQTTTPTKTATRTPTPTNTNTPSITPTNTNTPSITPTNTKTPTPTPTPVYYYYDIGRAPLPNEGDNACITMFTGAYYRSLTPLSLLQFYCDSNGYRMRVNNVVSPGAYSIVTMVEGPQSACIDLTC